MRYEFHRPNSFRDVTSENIPSQIKLASNGWFSTGNGNEMKCFSCGISYTNWKRYCNPAEIQQSLSPNCLMVLGKDNDNIPFGLQKKDEMHSTENPPTHLRGNDSKDTHHALNEQHEDGIQSKHNSEDSIIAKQNMKPIIQPSGNIDAKHSLVAVNDIAALPLSDKNNAEFSRISVDQLSVSNDFNSIKLGVPDNDIHTSDEFAVHENQGYESDNLYQFSASFSNSASGFDTNVIQPHPKHQELATSKRIYTSETKQRLRKNDSSRKTCHEKEDFPAVDTFSMPADQNNNSTPCVQNKVFSATANVDTSIVVSTQKRNGAIKNPKSNSDFGMQQVLPPLTKEDPKYPQYVVLAVRISSYSGWPSYLKQTERDLSLAGFFFRGYSDEVTCYQCGITLANWQDEDDACVEHARWKPGCYYIRTYKGDEFVNLVQAALRQLQQQPQNSIPQRTKQQNVSQDREKRHQRTHRQRNRNGNIIDKLIEMNFSEEYIQTAIAILERRQSSGRNITIGEMLDIFFTDQSNSISSSVRSFARSSPSSVTSLSHSIETSLLRDGQMTSFISNDSQSKMSASGDAEENNAARVEDEHRKKMECKICLDNEVGMVFVPCGHICVCSKCSDKLYKCPVCKTHIKKKIRGYLS